MSIGIWQVLIILLIVMIVFGAGKLPRAMGDLAKGLRNFRAGLKEDEPGETARLPDGTAVRDAAPSGQSQPAGS